MSDMVLALGIIAGGGFFGFLLAMVGKERFGAGVGALASVVGSALGLGLAFGVLRGGTVPAFRTPWALPGAEIHIAIDPLSALFLLPIFGVGALAAVYGAGYLDHVIGAKRLAPQILFFNLLQADLAVVVIARDVFLFIFAWELMTLLGFLLVSFEDEQAEVRRAAFIYIAISHVAAMGVLLVFLALGRDAASFDLDVIASLAAGSAGRTGVIASALFVAALLGFGTKAGVAPFHIWLPHAHPAAPAHVSAVMSGVIVKTALYAFLRAVTLLGPGPAWWGFAVIGLGVLSAVGGILFGAVQGNLKRLLAYSTIENIGIVFVGLGTGMIGTAYGNGAVAVLGFTGALMHVINHAVMKGLLFAAAGAVVHATHTRSIEQQGGLWKRMPVTAVTFLVGALAVSGLPGLAGFASEWLVYAGLLRGGLELDTLPAAVTIGAIPALAVVGGLAALALTKAFGLCFLGEPRSEGAAHAHEAPLAMCGPLVILAALAIVLGLAPSLVVGFVAPIAGTLARLEPHVAAAVVGPAVAPLASISLAAGLLIAFCCALALLRRSLLSARRVEAVRTWGCGFGAPTARMQYTAASFARPMAEVAHDALRPRLVDRPPLGYFPGPSVRHTTVDDPAEEHLFGAAVRGVERRLLAFRWLQQGRLSLYLLYVFVAVVLLLVWQVLWSGGMIS